MNRKRGMNSITKFGICLGLCVMLSGCGDDSENLKTQVEDLQTQVGSLQTQVREITAQRDAAQKNAVHSDKENTMLWWSIPLLLVGALGYGTVMGLKSRADVKKRAKNNENV